MTSAVDTTTARPPCAPRRHTVSITAATLFAAVAVGGGIAARAWLLAGPLGRATSDDAVVGLMARAALDGDLSIFFWGQAYGGTQESLLTAVVFAIVGTSTLALKSVPLALYAAASLLLHRIGVRAVGEPAARVAAALPFVFPVGFVWWTTQARGFYAFTTVCGLAAVLAAQRIAAAPSTPAIGDALLLGGVLGLGAWASPQIAFFALPVVAWLLARHPRVLHRWPWILGAAVAGAAPWLFDLVAHGRSPVGEVVRIEGIGLDDRAVVFFRGLPQTLGIQAPFSHDWLVPLGPVAGPLAVAGAAAATLLLARRRGPSPRREALEPVLAMALAYPALFALSPFSLSPDAVRYFSYLVPCVALGAGWLLTRSHAALVIGTVVVAVTLVLGLQRIDRFSIRPPCWEELRPPDLEPLVAALDAADRDALVAEYWLAYRVTFETGGRIVATPNDRVRHLPTLEAVEARGGFRTYAFLANDGPEEEVFVGVVSGSGIPYQRVEAGGTVLYLLKEEIEPSKVTFVPATFLSRQCLAES